MAVNVPLGVHIFRHILMHIQMVGGQVGDNGDVGAAREVHELEGAELHHGEILRLHLLRQGQQGRADVAPQPDPASGLPEQLRDQRGGSRLAVGAGHGDDRAGAHPEKRLHLRGDLRAGLLQRRKLRPGRMQAGGAENNIALQPLQIIRPHLQAAATGLQGQDLGLQLFIGRGVAAGDVAAGLEQHAHQGPVADPQAEHQDLFARQGLEPGADFRIHGKPLFHRFPHYIHFGFNLQCV